MKKYLEVIADTFNDNRYNYNSDFTYWISLPFNVIFALILFFVFAVVFISSLYHGLYYSLLVEFNVLALFGAVILGKVSLLFFTDAADEMVQLVRNLKQV